MQSTYQFLGRLAGDEVDDRHNHEAAQHGERSGVDRRLEYVGHCVAAKHADQRERRCEDEARPARRRRDVLGV